MKNVFFSIIIPVYNVKDYIEECIKSIVDQNYKNYELILVDDGSTDGTGILLDSYENIPQIKIYHKQNEGPSKARNFGIERSKGDYLMFIDSDDMLYSHDCLEKLNNYLNGNQYDIIQYKMVFLYNNKYKHNKNIVDVNYINEKNDRLMILNQNGNISASPCDKIVKASLIKENNIYFPEGMLHEDIKWSYELYMKAENIEVLNEEFYVYRQQRLGSTTSTKSKKSAQDLFSIIKYFLDFDYANESEKKLYYNMISYWYLILRVNYKKDYYTNEMKMFFKQNDKNIINFNDNYKVRKVYKLSKIMGFGTAIIAMKVYNFLKNKGIIKF